VKQISSYILKLKYIKLKLSDRRQNIDQMKHYVLEKISHGQDVAYLTLSPSSSADRIKFQPGQYAAVGFMTRRGKRSLLKSFSIVNSPANSNLLSFGVKVEGKFTRALAELEPGNEMFIEGPFGEFQINERHDKRVVMLAGGIGITPFMSMIRSANETHSRLPITLLYSYRSGHHIPFNKELQDIASTNKNIEVYTFVTGQTPYPEAPLLLSGKISKRHIEQVTSGQYFGSTYFLCGPKGFMKAVQNMLVERGVNEDRIITESFTQISKVLTPGGYSLPRLTYTSVATVFMLGLITITALDVDHYVELNNQATARSVSTNTSSPQSTSTSNSSSNTNTNSTSSNSDTSSASSQSQSNTPAATYYQPVSSVS